MSGVRLLDDTVVNQIAAGEVVERPASVVKELIENSLDAGATRIEVELKRGGSDRIRVRDDGAGMDRADALMCLERHATSKLTVADDLVGITSMGFRGEAIPSIASVSRFSILTRPHDAEAGVRVVVDGGQLASARPAGCAAGTEIDVRELFFNVPVRRKFLRTVGTELAHSQEAVVRLALSRPDVAFKLTHEGRTVFASTGTDAASRAVDVLGRDAADLVPVTFEAEGLSVSGFISSVAVHRPATRALYTYVDGRFVRDGVIRRAIAEAYRDRVPRGRSPLVLLHLRLPRGGVDVNVHPAKTEVRFASPRSIQEHLTNGLREALQRHQVRRHLEAAPRVARSEPSSLPLPLAPTAPVVPAHPDDDPVMRLATPAQSVPTVRPQPVPVAVPSPPPAPSPPLVEDSPAFAEDAPSTRSLRAIGPYGRRWILAEGDGALVVIDHVHADELLTARRLVEDGRAERLLVPRRERLAESEVQILKEAAADLAALGMEILVISPTEIAIRAVPAVLPRLHLDGLGRKLAGDPTQAATILARSQTLPPPPDAHQLKKLLASLEEKGMDAVVRTIPTSELLRAGH